MEAPQIAWERKYHDRTNSSMTNWQWNATPYVPNSTISACLRPLSGYLLAPRGAASRATDRLSAPGDGPCDELYYTFYMNSLEMFQV